MPRLFIAVVVPPLAPLCEVLGQLAKLRPMVKPVDADQLHLTLRFLGEVPIECVNTIAIAMEHAAKTVGAIPFDLRFVKLGRFPSNEDLLPRVIFAEPTDAAPLQQLADALDEVITKELPLLSKRDHPFHAHLTLARVKSKRPSAKDVRQTLNDLLCDTRKADLGTTRIKSLYLIESRLTSSGSIYALRHTHLFTARG